MALEATKAMISKVIARTQGLQGVGTVKPDNSVTDTQKSVPHTSLVDSSKFGPSTSSPMATAPLATTPELATTKPKGTFTTPDSMQRSVPVSSTQPMAATAGEAMPANSVTPSSVAKVESGNHSLYPSSSAEMETQNNTARAISSTKTEPLEANTRPSGRVPSAVNAKKASTSKGSSSSSKDEVPKAYGGLHQQQSKSKKQKTKRTTTPVPPMGNISKNKQSMRTPIRSPNPSGYDFPTFASPSIFLSPYVPSPPDAVDKKVNGDSLHSGKAAPSSGIMSNNFATDFGKSDMADDALNNVLPWLSPNAYQLFSPEGGLTASITPNKPGNGNFSLPLDNSRKSANPTAAVASAKSGGMMICVSPLARKNGTFSNKLKQPDTPINFQEVFASPLSGRGYYNASNEIPSISECSVQELGKHLTERSSKEDEDLNVLLELAKTTPRPDTLSSMQEGTKVFRGAGGALTYPAGQPIGPPSFLHLPVIAKHPSTTMTINGQKQISVSPKKRKTPGATFSASDTTSSLYTGINGVTSSSISTKSALPETVGSKKKSKSSKNGSSSKRPLTTTNSSNNKRTKKAPTKGRGPGKRNKANGTDKKKSAAATSAVPAGKSNDKAASLASAILRGVTMRPSGKWQAQLYFAGKSRYIGVFDSREKAALAYEIAREHLQNKNSSTSKDTDAHVNAARKAAFAGVNEQDPRA
ncbi:hypothetical protein CTEN210_03373 [Chaetoceros tenuissimus]|uniref:AP2/ERF domain-containing protein n=1 Tax=Chaetoceros tenuissimus TaxID=426638 RepID=A0AAD3CJM5_9STRA|nr:hypothetical protein CTEN210_03373 [Chaetoceros tenuissimus]